MKIFSHSQNAMKEKNGKKFQLEFASFIEAEKRRQEMKKIFKKTKNWILFLIFSYILNTLLLLDFHSDKIFCKNLSKNRIKWIFCNSTKISSTSNLTISTSSPSSSPAIFDQPIILSIFSSITNE